MKQLLTASIVLLAQSAALPALGDSALDSPFYDSGVGIALRFMY